ncbi:MAG: hypothetical protein HZB55_15005 [Deltaproteobacteria bacterium]|nr:hypothetical protein [Deltaproteobacteria bacterium]
MSLAGKPVWETANEAPASESELKEDGVEPILEALDAEHVPQVQAACRYLESILVVLRGLPTAEEEERFRPRPEANAEHRRPDLALGCLPPAMLTRQEEEKKTERSPPGKPARNDASAKMGGAADSIQAPSPSQEPGMVV